MRTPFAQDIQGTSDKVHIFIDDAPSINPKSGEPQDTRKALCNKRIALDTNRRKYRVSREILEEEYLIRQDEVIGKLCGNCMRKLQGRFERGEMEEW